MRACADFFGDEPFLVISGDALTDIDLSAFVAATARRAGSRRWRSSRCPTRASTASCCTTATGASRAFRRSPPEEALSDLGNCGIYIFDPEIFDYFPDRPFADWARTCSRRCWRTTCPSTSTTSATSTGTIIGSLDELRQGTFDALCGELRLEMEGSEVQARRDRRG